MAHTVAAWIELKPGTVERTSTDADFGRATRLLRGEGIRVVVAEPAGLQITDDGPVITGWEPSSDRWRSSGPHPLHGVYNRMPARHPQHWRAQLQWLRQHHIPVGNPPSFNRLALDKGASLQVLADAGLPVPEFETDAEDFDLRLGAWGMGFLKPRFGSFGRGVVRVSHGQERPVVGRGEGPAILQRAVAPPRGPFSGMCVRGLVQRDVEGRWRTAGRVARVSTDDPVVNVARGARALTLEALAIHLPEARGLEDRLEDLEMDVVRALEDAVGHEAPSLLEVGVDWVLDLLGAPWIIEINGKPGGRLRVLAQLEGEAGRTWKERHVDALVAPFRRLAAAYITSSGPADS